MSSMNFPDPNVTPEYKDWVWDGEKWVKDCPASGGGGGGSFPEAPVDGKQYGRQNASWTEIVGGGTPANVTTSMVKLENPTRLPSGLENQQDANAYIAESLDKLIDQDGNVIKGGIEEAPSDSVIYGRQNQGWVAVPTGGGGGDVDLSAYYTAAQCDSKFEPKISKNTAFNKNFGTSNGTVAQGNHTHSQYIQTETDPTVPSYVKSISQADINKWNSAGGGSDTLQSVTDRGATTTQNIQCPNLFTKNNGYTLGGTASGGNRLVLSNGFYFYNQANVPALSCTEAGSVSAADFVASSDERLKDNITTAPVGFIDSLKGREWEWKESGEKGSGVVAQELEKVLPHLVHTDDDGMKSVAYNGLVAYLIEEVKALRAEVEALK